MGNGFLHGKGGAMPIKSIQFGSSLQSASQTDITLATAVESDNSIVIIQPCGVDSGATYYQKTLVGLTDTTLSLSAGEECRYTVIEFPYGLVKSIQRGRVTPATANPTINHSSVDTAKSFILFDSSAYINFLGVATSLAYLLSRTSTSFTCVANHFTDGVDMYIEAMSYQIVEFY